MSDNMTDQDRFMRLLESINQKLDKANKEISRLKVEVATGRVEYLTIKMAAERTHLSYDTVRRAVEAGDLPASNKGTGSKSLWRIAKVDLDVWMQKHKGGRIAPTRSEFEKEMAAHLPGVDC